MSVLVSLPCGGTAGAVGAVGAAEAAEGRAASCDASDSGNPGDSVGAGLVSAALLPPDLKRLKKLNMG